MNRLNDIVVLIKGAGDMASGVAARLHLCGFEVVMTELPQPMMVRRSVSFGSAAYEGRVEVEGIEGRLVATVADARSALASGAIPVLIDPGAACRVELKPVVLIDAIMAKQNTGTTRADAALVIGLGPGFTAGRDCHAVIETNRGHWLGRVIRQGSAEPDTQTPGNVAGRQRERVLRAPVDGVLEAKAEIGDQVTEKQLIATVNGTELRAGCSGILRGLIHSGLWVNAGLKVGDVDPRGERAHSFTISEKSLAIGGGVLEAILSAPQLV